MSSAIQRHPDRFLAFAALDAPACEPLLAAAVRLGVPIYLHPGPPTAFLRAAPISPRDRDKIAFGNAERLLGIGRRPR